MNDLIGKIFLCVKDFHYETLEKGNIVLVLENNIYNDDVCVVLVYPKMNKDQVLNRYFNKTQYEDKYFKEIL